MITQGRWLVMNVISNIDEGLSTEASQILDAFYARHKQVAFFYFKKIFFGFALRFFSPFFSDMTRLCMFARSYLNQMFAALIFSTLSLISKRNFP
jgi:hypothetical protein